jgi:signal peptidase
MTRAAAWRRRGALLALPVGAVMVSLLVPVAVFLGTTWLQGRTLHLVESGSMEPAYPIGSVLVVEPIEPAAVRVGSTIAFIDPARRLVSHRVTEIVHRNDTTYFRVKGDANLRADPGLVPATALRGGVAWDVPKLGRLLEWLRWPKGFVLLVGVPAVILIGTEASRWRRRDSSQALVTPATSD